MTNRKNTRRALVLSLLSLLVCCSMLVGTTFAWFTDSVQTGSNRIVAGNLDVDLLNAEGQSVAGVENLFDDVTKWEPGAVAWETLTVKNLGTLALKYELKIRFFNENTVVEADGKDTGLGLSDILQVAFIEGGVKGTTREEVLKEAAAANISMNLADFVIGGELLPKTETTDGESDPYGIVIWWAPGATDNTWNINNGKDTSDGKELHIDLDVRLDATQKVYEDDSFGPDYDAGLETTYVSDYAQLVAALAEGGKVVLENDIVMPDDVLPKVPEGVTAVLDLGGYTLDAGMNTSREDRHMYAIENRGTLTVMNGTINGRGIANYGKLATGGKLTINALDTNGGGAVWGYTGSETIISGSTLIAADDKTAPGAVALNVAAGAKATINSGKLVGNADQTYAIITDGELTVNGGEISADHGVISSTGTTVLNGGTFVQNGNLVQTSSLLYIAGGQTTVTGGEFNFNVGGKLDSGLPVYCAAGSVAISGGTFTGYVTEMISSWGGSGSASVTGGTYDKEPGFVANGYVAQENSNGTWTVVPEKYTTAVADGLYSDGAAGYAVSNANGLAALNAMMVNKTAGRNATVELTADIDMTGKTWTPVDSHADTTFSFAALNGNGHIISNLTVNGQAMFKRFAGSGDVVIKDVTFENANINSTAINSAILTAQSYQNVTLDNVDVIDSYIKGGYKVAPLIATVYNESSSTITATLKNCDVKNTTVEAVTYDFCTAGMVAFVYADDNDKITFENCTVSNVKLIAPLDSYQAHAFVYTTDSESLYNEATGVTVTDCSVETRMKKNSTTTFAGGTLYLQDGTYVTAAEGKNALTITGDTTLVVNGKATLGGGKNGSGIYVADGVKLTIEGDGELTVYGNGQMEYEASGNYCEFTDASFAGAGGSGIRGGEGSTITINGLSKLTAEGYGVHGFGIGGNGATVTIEDTTIDYVRGGFVNLTGNYNDAKYNKSEPNGGAAIGGEKITLTNVVINKAEGGSKAAGIGALYHQSTEITITDSYIKSVVGGASAAAIGGSRVSEPTTDDENVTITIVDSVVTAQGGYFGAGIGSGYNTYCQTPDKAPMTTINIKGDSVITATGGKYAAGIGTGYHVANLSGEIETSVKVTAASGEKFYKDTYTQAQDIGWGVTDPAREGLNNTSTFTYNGVANGIPAVN